LPVSPLFPQQAESCGGSYPAIRRNLKFRSKFTIETMRNKREQSRFSGTEPPNYFQMMVLLMVCHASEKIIDY
jgi:hypothetical protein